MNNNYKKKIERFVESYALKSGYILNKNKEVLNIIINGLTKNKEKYGHPYCPCRIITGDESKDKDKICPCKYHIEEIKTNGSCHCNLFYKNEF